MSISSEGRPASNTHVASCAFSYIYQSDVSGITKFGDISGYRVQCGPSRPERNTSHNSIHGNKALRYQQKMKVVGGYSNGSSKRGGIAIVGPAKGTAPTQISHGISDEPLDFQSKPVAEINHWGPAWAPAAICGLFVQYECADDSVIMPQTNWPIDDPNAAAAHAKKFDQFFTREEVARDLLGEFYKRYGYDGFLFIEPSAGLGAFLKHMPAARIGIDLDRKIDGLLVADFLTVTVRCEQPIAIVGNPPFGKNAALAIKFFNHAATMADLIAFIVPLSFKKASVQRKLNVNFHLVAEIELPDNAFTFMSKPKHVPTVFQIWQRRDDVRQLNPLKTSHPDFEFVDRDSADFAIQRVGARAGRIHHDFKASTWRPGEKPITDHYFVRGPVQHIFKKLDFAAAASNTAGNPSLAKSEIVALYSAYLESDVMLDKLGKRSLAGSILTCLREARRRLVYCCRLGLRAWRPSRCILGNSEIGAGLR